jgi:hypothetical protein
VARVVWQDADHRQAQVDVSVGSDPAALRTHAQSLAFAAADPPAERGRSIGFVIAAFVLAGREPAPASPARAPAAPQARPGLAAAAGPPPGPAHPDGRRAVEAFGVLALPLSDEGGGIGAGLAARWRAADRWGLRLGLSAQTGTIGVAQASLLSLGLAAGATRVLAGSGGSSGPAVVLRVDAMLLYEALTHFSSDDPAPVRHGRWLPGAASLLELEWPLGPSAAIHVAAGLQAAFGTTEVVLHLREVAEISPWRMVTEAGFRTSF